MFYEKDYIMRQIELLARALAKIFFGKDTSVSFEAGGFAQQVNTDLLYLTLKDMVVRRKLNEAENFLFETIVPGDRRHLKIALIFYEWLRDLGDDELTANGFSMEEVRQGLEALAKLYGVDFI